MSQPDQQSIRLARAAVSGGYYFNSLRARRPFYARWYIDRRPGSALDPLTDYRSWCDGDSGITYWGLDLARGFNREARTQ